MSDARYHAPRRYLWPVAGAVLTALVLLLPTLGMVSSEIVPSSIRASGGPGPGAGIYAPATPAHSSAFAPSYVACPGATWMVCAVQAPTSWNCEFVSLLTLGVFGPGCGYDEASAAWQGFATSSIETSANNTMTGLGNALNITAASTANLNATMQELLSYYEGRAEAIVPHFVALSWNQSTQDQIAVDSGLVPAIEGMDMALASQVYQDWNGTAHTWDNLFGPSGAFCGQPAEMIGNGTYLSLYPDTAIEILTASQSGDCNGLRVTNPWEVWSVTNSSTGRAQAPLFFNLAPGGTIVCAQADSEQRTSVCPTLTVHDYTQGFSFSVPSVNYTNWLNSTNIPIETTAQGVQPFDLLQLTCASGCTSSNIPWVEVSNGYAFRNISTTVNPDTINEAQNAPYPDTMTYTMGVSETLAKGGYMLSGWAPTNSVTYCIHDSGATIAGPCSTPKTLGEGVAHALGTGPASVPGGNNILTRYASTMQSLVNNTLLSAEVYFDTLRALTDGGNYTIPATCVIPPPSAAFPTSLNPALYRLNVQEGLASYWSYLLATGTATPFGNTTVAGVEVCGNPNLALRFSWSPSWELAVNITASVYLAGLNDTTVKPVYPNGTADPLSVYANPTTWPIKKIDPTLLFPYEYQINIPTNTVYPLPINDPMASLLVNWSGNAFYGSVVGGNLYGIPTYLQLDGNGNYIYANGTLSSVASGYAPAAGDAIDITSCIINGAAQNPCDLSVVYFDAFTYGHVSALVGPSGLPSPYGGNLGAALGALGTTCGFQFFDQPYDAWAGYIGSAVASPFGNFANAVTGIPVVGGPLSLFVEFLGCAIGWIVVIGLVIGALWLLVKAVELLFPSLGGSGGGPRWNRSRSASSRSAGTTVNVRVGSGRLTRRNHVGDDWD